MRKGILSVCLCCFLILLATGESSLATSRPDSAEAGSVDLRNAMSGAEWVLPAQPTLRTARQQDEEDVHYCPVLSSGFHTSYFAISNGILANTGPDLITFIHLRTT